MGPSRVMFVYWGRRGALSQFTLEVSRAALANKRIEATISVSRQNESFASYKDFGSALFAIDTFDTNVGAVLEAWRIPLLRRQLYQRLRNERTQAVIELMPHVWSPFAMPVVRAAGARYCTIIHDAIAHPGDRTSRAKMLLDASARSADLVVTLSSAVARQLVSTGQVPQAKVRTMFHPDLNYGVQPERVPPSREEPLRLLFLGRIMSYKGLPLLLDTVELLRESGIAVEVGVFGEGSLGPSADRLQRLGAEVVNRWLTEDEIRAILPRFHAVVLSHIEASQSGVAAVAFGAGMPVIATPVGGLVEQVTDGLTGTLARRTDAAALAESVTRLLLNPRTYSATCQNIVRLSAQRSMARFVKDIVWHALNSAPTVPAPVPRSSEEQS